MIRHYRTVLHYLIFISTVIAFATPSVRAAKFRDISVSEIPLVENDEQTCRGYNVFRLRVKNEGGVARSVELKTPSANYRSNGQYIAALTRSLQLDPGQTVTVELYQPPIQMWTGGLTLTVDGRSEPFPTMLDSMHTSLDYDEDTTPVVFCSRSISGDFRDQIMKRFTPKSVIASSSSPGYSPSGHYGSGPSDYCRVLRAAVSMADWPAHWLSYSRFDAVVLSQQDYHDLPADAKTALADYLSSGGLVWITPQKNASPLPLDELRQAEGYGCLLTEADPRMDRFANRIGRVIQQRSTVRSGDEASRMMPVVDRGRVPVRLISILLIVYAVLVGPFLQIALKIKRRRIWILWIVPVTSLSICMVASVWTYYSEGFHGHTRMQLVTLLDQSSGRATTHGMAGFYSPLTDGYGLKFSGDCMLHPQWKSRERYYGYGRRQAQDEDRSVQVDWTSGQHLSRGWLLAKTPLHFKLWKVERRREKLMMRPKDDATFDVTNALGADVKRALIRLPDDAKGGTRWAEIDGLPAGATIEVETTSSSPVSANALIDYLLSQSEVDGGWNAALPGNLDRLQVGMYAAVMQGHPMVETAMRDPATDRGTSWIIGKFELEDE